MASLHGLCRPLPSRCASRRPLAAPSLVACPLPSSCGARVAGRLTLCRAQQGHDDEDRAAGKGQHQDVLLASLRKQYQAVVRAITPKEAGDTADWAWMVISTLVLVWFSAGLYRIYAHLYYAAGLHTFAEMMAR